MVTHVVQDDRHWATLRAEDFCWLARSDFWPGWWGTLTRSHGGLVTTAHVVAQWRRCYGCASLEMRL